MIERQEFIPRAHPAVASVELDGEAILYDQRDGHVHVLNHTASLIWSCLGTEGRVGDLVDDLADAYGVSSATLEADVLATIEQFADEGLLDDGNDWQPLVEEVLPTSPRYLDEPPSV